MSQVLYKFKYFSLIHPYDISVRWGREGVLPAFKWGVGRDIFGSSFGPAENVRAAADLSSMRVSLLIDCWWPLATQRGLCWEDVCSLPSGNHSFTSNFFKLENTMAIVLFSITLCARIRLPKTLCSTGLCLANVNCNFCKDAAFRCRVCCDLGFSSLLWNAPRCFASFKDLTWPWPAL